MNPRKLITAMSRRLSRSRPVLMLCMITHTTILRHTLRSRPCRVFILPLFINHPWKVFMMALRSPQPTFRLFHLVFRFLTSRIRNPTLRIIRRLTRRLLIHRILSRRTPSYQLLTTLLTEMRTRLRHTKTAPEYWTLSLITPATISIHKTMSLMGHTVTLSCLTIRAYQGTTRRHQSLRRSRMRECFAEIFGSLRCTSQ